MEFPRGCIALNNITLNGKTGNFALHKPEGKAVQFYDLSDPRNFFLKSEIEKSEKAYAHTYSGAYPFTFRQPIKHKIAFKSTILYPFIP